MIEKLQDQLLYGLGSDLELAYYNRNILFQLREIQPKLSESTNDSIKSLFQFLSHNSKNSTILYLSRIYDKPNDSKTRCLLKFINQLESSKKSKVDNIIHEILWNNFCTNHSTAFSKIGKPNHSRYLLTSIRSYIETHALTKGSALFKLKEWRDGYIAHNDSAKDVPTLSDEEIEELLSIGELALEFINQFVGIGAGFHLNKPEGEFVEEIFADLLKSNV